MSQLEMAYFFRSRQAPTTCSEAICVNNEGIERIATEALKNAFHVQRQCWPITAPFVVAPVVELDGTFTDSAGNWRTLNISSFHNGETIDA